MCVEKAFTVTKTKNNQQTNKNHQLFMIKKQKMSLHVLKAFHNMVEKALTLDTPSIHFLIIVS